MILIIGVVVATHGELANAILKTVKMFYSDLENVESVCLESSTNLDEFEKNMLDSYQRVNSGSGVLFLTDLFGGTPANKAMQLVLSENDVECVTGLNLGMLLEVLLSRTTKNLKDLATLAVSSGSVGIEHLKR